MTPASCQLAPMPPISPPGPSPSTIPHPFGLTVLRPATAVLEWSSPSIVTRPAHTTSPRSRNLPRLSMGPPPGTLPALTTVLPVAALAPVTVRCPTPSEVVWLSPLSRLWLDRYCRSMDFDPLTFHRWIPPYCLFYCSG